MNSLIRVSALALLFSHLSVLAHHCPESPLRMHVGDVSTVRITADVAESEESHYNLSINSDPTIATVEPDNFNSFAYGEFRVHALKLGTNDIVLEWSYAPTDASGFCVVQVIVEPPPADPRDAADDTTAAETEEAGRASDPVNTYTGEYVLTEPSDLDLGAPMPVRFTRYYASGLSRQELVHSGVGRNWMHNYDVRLVQSATNLNVVFHGGKVIPFQADGSTWILSGSARIPYALQTTSSERLLLDPEKNWVYHFDADGKLTQIEDTRGNSLVLTYQAGQLQSVTDGLGRTLTLTYSGFQQIASVSDGVRTVRFSYIGENLSRVTDRAGGVTRYLYDDSQAGGALMTSKIYPDGNSPTTQAYDSKGRVTAQSRAEGGTYTFTYTNLQTIITNPEGGIQKHIHDPNGNLIELTEENQKTIRGEFDSAGRRISETTRSGQKYLWSYHAASGELLSATSPGNLSVSFERAERDFRGFKLYEVSRIVYSDGAAEQFEIDAQGNIISLIDRAGRKSTYAYNPQGRMLATTNPAGGTITCEYNPDGTRRLLHRQVPGEPVRTTSFFYDNLKRLSRIEYADGTHIEYAYNNLDLLQSLKDEDSGVTSYEYSANGLLKKVTYPLGNTIRMAYDRMNELTNVTDHAGHSITRAIDPMGRLQSITDRNGNRQSFAYDALGHLTNYMDAAGNPWSRALDVEGRVISETDPLGHTRQYQYDSAGRVREISDPPEEFRLTYNELGQPLTMEFPPGRTNFLAYDPDGMLSRVSLAGIVTSEYVSDPLGSIGTIKDPNGKAWQMVNDEFGRPRQFIDPLLRTNRFVLDERERVSRLVFPAQLGSISNIFNGRGQITHKAFSDGAALDFAYDANGRIVSGTGLTLSYNEQDEIITCNGLALGRDAGGRLTSVTLAPGKTIQYAYDSRNLLTNITDWLGGSTSFQYDTASRLISITRPNGVKTTCAYDAANRLTGIKEENDQILASINLARDSAGLILSAQKTLPFDPVLTNGAITRTYDAASQIVGAGYDPLGRMASDGPRRFEWDLASRLTSCSIDSTNLDFTYDAFGDLLSQAQNGARREYVWNLALRLRSPVVIRDSGHDSVYLVHTPRGELVYSIDASSGQRHFFHFDESGNTLFLTDDAGKITDSYAYTPYGLLADRAGASSTPFTFGGRYSLISFPGLELISVRQRWLDTRNGRFLSRDPNWGLSINPNELNPYAYARSNPLYYADPLGLDARVNQTGVHTDISVDIWQGDQVVGTLTVSYAAKGYKGKFGGATEAFWTVIGGTQGEFSIDFKPGCVRDTANPDSVSRGTQIIIDGTREQDERLRLALAGLIGADGDWEFVGRGQSIIRNFIYQSRKVKNQHLVVDATIDDWETYRAASQSCNDFTDAMLDIYFGENWYLGPIFEGDGLTSELKEHLKTKSSSPVLDPNGIARITGSTLVR